MEIKTTEKRMVRNVGIRPENCGGVNSKTYGKYAEICEPIFKRGTADGRDKFNQFKTGGGQPLFKLSFWNHKFSDWFLRLTKIAKD